MATTTAAQLEPSIRVGGDKDFRDLLRVFVAYDVRFLVVDAYALAVLGRPRATGVDSPH